MLGKVQSPSSNPPNLSPSTIQGDNSYLNTQKDLKEAETAPKYGETWSQVQNKYGGKAEKPREIKKTLGKDDFLRIMITQLKNQDPTQPFKAEQFASELAQYASVEQLQNINSTLGKMNSQSNPLERLAMTNLIGKSITIDRDRFPHTEGMSDGLSFQLPKDAASVDIHILSESGESILEKNIGPQKIGQNSFNWDGLKTSSLPAKSGNYLFRIEAKDEKGVSISTNPTTKSKVIGISFEGSEPVFLVGDFNKPDKVTLRNIVKIETENETQEHQKKTPELAQEVPKQSVDAKKNLFTFQRGVGSQNLDREPTPREPMGFPNGLSDSTPTGGDELEK